MLHTMLGLTAETAAASAAWIAAAAASAASTLVAANVAVRGMQ